MDRIKNKFETSLYEAISHAAFVLNLYIYMNECLSAEYNTQ